MPTWSTRHAHTFPSSSYSAILLPLHTTQSLRANYLQEIDFFANPELHDCYRVGGNSCSRLPQCGVENDNRGSFNACYELVNRCSDAGRTICENGAVEWRGSTRTTQNLGLCVWSGGRNGRCSLPRNRDRTTVRLTMSGEISPRSPSAIRLSESEDYLDYEEDVTDSSEDYDYNDYDYYEDEEEGGEDGNNNCNIHHRHLLLILPLLHTGPMYSLLVPIFSLVCAAEVGPISIFVQRSMGNRYPLARIFSLAS